MRQYRTSGTVQGAPGNRRSYCETILHSLIRAENGEKEGVLDLLNYFCEVVDVERQPDRAVMEFVAERFRKILDGEKPDKAFGFIGNQGRPKSETLERYFLLAIAMVNEMKSGLTKEQALARVAALKSVSESVINRAWLKDKGIIDDKDIAAYKELTKVKFIKHS